MLLKRGNKNYTSKYIRGLIFAATLLLLVQNFACTVSKQKNNSKMKPSLSGAEMSNSTITSQQPVKISDQFKFTEGPAVDKHGNIFFTDQPNNKIWKYDIDGKLSVFMEDTRRSNGMYFDEHGNLISCADEHNQVINISSDKKISILVNDYNGKTFNGPNDVWVNKKTGGIYFTDPYYKRDYWKTDHTHMEEQRVYFLPKNSKEPLIVDDQLVKPNGIIGTPDGKWLFVADIGGNKTYKFEIAADGTLINKKIFVNQGSDGMTMDTNGNVYLSGKGVTIFNGDGKMIQHIPIDEDWTGNICFGGKDMHDLFITASKSIYIVHTNVTGIK